MNPFATGSSSNPSASFGATRLDEDPSDADGWPFHGLHLRMDEESSGEAERFRPLGRYPLMGVQSVSSRWDLCLVCLVFDVVSSFEAIHLTKWRDPDGPIQEACRPSCNAKVCGAFVVKVMYRNALEINSLFTYIVILRRYVVLSYKTLGHITNPKVLLPCCQASEPMWWRKRCGMSGLRKRATSTLDCSEDRGGLPKPSIGSTGSTTGLVFWTNRDHWRIWKMPWW